MSARAERERRRQERLVAEQAELASARRRLVFGYVAAGALTLAVIVGLVVALGGGGGGGDAGGDVPANAHVQVNSGFTHGYSFDDRVGTPPPALQQGDLQKAAAAAGCELKLNLPNEGQTHITKESQIPDYKTNPPTSGNHNPTPAPDGIYRAGNTPPKENFVHSLEHGRIEFQYKAGAPAADVAKLRALAEEPINDTAGYHMLMFENNTNMPTEYAATAWTKSISCKALTPQAIDAMREFRKSYTDKGPEFIP
jgi:Protein of unknown function (DUF3105)